jgi:hypothetical protein
VLGNVIVGSDGKPVDICGLPEEAIEGDGDCWSRNSIRGLFVSVIMYSLRFKGSF